MSRDATSSADAEVPASASVQSGTIVVVVDDLNASAAFLRHLSVEAQDRRFRMLVVPAAADLGIAEVSAIVPGLSGVVIWSAVVDPDAFLKTDRPLLFVFDHAYDGLDFDQLIHDADHAGNRAAEYIASAGRTSVAIVGAYDPDRPVVRGFLKGVSTYDLVVSRDHIIPCFTDRRDAAMQFKAFLSRASALPHAVYCTDGNVACGVYETLHSEGFAVPGDIWIVGNGRSPLTGAPFYDITTIAPSTKDMAVAALDLLVARIDGFDGQARIRHITYQMTPGATTDYFNVMRSTK